MAIGNSKVTVYLSPFTDLHLSTIGSINSSPTKFDMIILIVSDSLNYNVAFFFDFKQLPNVEILSSLLTESEKRKI